MRLTFRYGVNNYTFGVKEEQDVGRKLDGLVQEYESNGMRTTVEAVLIVHEHKTPHILVLQPIPSSNSVLL